MRTLCRLILRLFGWKTVGTLPCPKCIVIGAPHNYYPGPGSVSEMFSFFDTMGVSRDGNILIGPSASESAYRTRMDKTPE